MDGLHNLKRPEGSHRDRKRVGRGPGSGTGKTSGYGHKGSKARAGHHGPGGSKPHFEGGQMPLQRRLPKRGFRPVSRVRWEVVNLGELAVFPAGSVVGPAELRARGLVRRDDPIKCLGDGTLSHALTVRAHAFSARAREQIAAAGGSVEVLDA